MLHFPVKAIHAQRGNSVMDVHSKVWEEGTTIGISYLSIEHTTSKDRPNR